MKKKYLAGRFTELTKLAAQRLYRVKDKYLKRESLQPDSRSQQRERE